MLILDSLDFTFKNVYSLPTTNNTIISIVIRCLIFPMDLTMFIIYFLLLIWFIQAKYYIFRIKHEHTSLSISLRSHLKLIWVVSLTTLFAITDLTFQFIYILRNFSILYDRRQSARGDFLEKTSCAFIFFLMPFVDYMMAFSFLYFSVEYNRNERVFLQIDSSVKPYSSRTSS